MSADPKALSKAADRILSEHDDPKATTKDRGYAKGGIPSKYLPGGLPSTWQRGDPEPTHDRASSDNDAAQYDPRVDGRDPSPERGTDGDDKAGGPLERMADPNVTPGETDDPAQGKYKGPPWPDRKRDPFGWEMFFRNMMRQSPWSTRQTPWTLARAMLSASSVCRYCNGEFEQAETGRPREYCSDACQQNAYRERRRRVTKRG